MPVTSADLWKLLRQSRLISAERLEQMCSAFGQAGNAPDQVPAKALAQWLLQRQMLTPYQARVLLNGRSGPFHYGDYQIQDRIRGGRFGKSFLALHLPSRFGVQLKFASSRIAQDPRLWNTARQYIHAMSPIVHDQLQRVFALEDESGYRYLVLERLAGVSLAEHLAEKGHLPVSTACRAVRLAALGLAALHESRLVHGDLRPENLWLEPTDNVKLLRDNLHPPIVPALWQPGLTAEQAAQADYMAPELAHPGTLLSPSTDIYALGCTLYQLLAGKVLFAGGDASAKLQRHATEPIQPIQAQAVPSALTQLIETLLAQVPAARPDMARDVAEQLLPFIEVSRQTVPRVAASATLLAFEESLRHPTAIAPPAPPPVIPEADEHPPLPQPPVQAIVPAHMTQEIAPEAIEVINADAPPADAITVVAEAKHSRPLHRLRRQRRSRRQQAIALSLLAMALLLTASLVTLNPRWRRTLLGRGEVVAERVETSAEHRASIAVPSGNKTASQGAPAQSRYEVRDDDGRLLWMTPTSGAPIQLLHVAPGVQLVLLARPHELISTTSGRQVLRALGPHFETAKQVWETASGYTFEQTAELMISLHVTESTPALSIVVRLRDAQSPAQLRTAWGDPAPVEYHGDTYFLNRDWAFLIPKQDPVTQFVMGSEPLIREVIDMRDTPPVLPRELARLLQVSDRERHVSLLFTPDFLTQDVLPADAPALEARQLREAVTWLLDNDVKACLVGMQFEETFFVELRTYGQLDLDGVAVADSLRDRIGKVPEQIESVFERIYPSVYWRRVALRFPEMVRFLHGYLRVGQEDGQAIVNAVLPAQAAHNLVFGTVMLLGMQPVLSGIQPVLSGIQPGGEPGTATTAPPAPSIPGSIDELLQQSLDLSFAQKSLEFAIEDLVSDIRESYPGLPFPFDIQILGSDLQLNGITRNQQISQFTAVNKTIGEILTAIVLRANPVVNVTDASDVEQKLIWVVGPDPTDPKKQILLITTRDAAQRKGYKFPAPFQPK